MLSVDDANKLVVPLALYASKDEPLDEVCSHDIDALTPHVTNVMSTVYQDSRGSLQELFRGQEW